VNDDTAYQQIRFDYADGVGRIVLNRPATLNSFTEVMHDEIRSALDFLESREDLRGLILTGTGRGFCAGQDLTERKPLPAGERRDLSEGLMKNYRPLVLRLKELPVPVVCFVNGVAAGVGASVALACDIVFAVQSARFIQAFSRIGLMPDGGATYFWPRLVGRQRTLGAAIFAEPIPAVQAEQWGLIWRCIPDDTLENTMQDVQKQLANGATRAYAAVKQALNTSEGNTLEAQLELEAHLQKALGYTDDYLEGMAAFAGKRPPSFTGR
jgi:2-(1,2-epoxy-1,2-dihydrophenyl)acetyl-CoA isomerase